MSALRIGMIGTRFAGLDGVSLEARKVAEVLVSLGHEVMWWAGRIGPGFAPAVVEPDAYFDTPHNHALNGAVFGADDCPESVVASLRQSAAALQARIDAWVEEASVDVLMPQNASAIPMQLPLGLAIARHVAHTGTPTVAHHHDFSWERERFWPNAVGDVLEEAFPPVLPAVSHLVINSLAAAELERRTGAVARLLPNIMDFANPPPPGNGAAFRTAAGLAADDVVILQPTRMIPRKGIEDTIELAHRLADPAIRVVVTHPEPDEGATYVEHLFALAERLGVDFRVVGVDTFRATGLADAYAAADLVTFPSRVEGFGNALLETFFFRRPLLVNRFDVYRADIGPRGVRAIEMDGELTNEVVTAASEWLADPSRWTEAVEANYEIGRRFFSYEVAGEVLGAALAEARAH
ncbi:MAG: glycosyltransferase family 4 protein [Acidimicrobiia bacterium]|nr:glycosyltransferase family 4 protein [Acidimicrobiia bacterium]